MYVNPFWFGFLLAMVAMLVLVIVLAFVKAKQDEREWEEYQPTEEELEEALTEITGKKFRIVQRNGHLVGEPIEEEKDESEDH